MTTYLCVSELDQILIVLDNLISLVFARFEQLRQCKPLPGHLIPVVGIHKLVVVHTVGGVPLHALDGGLAAVQGKNIVDEFLAGLRERQRLGWVWGVVFRRRGLADFEILARRGGGVGEVGFAGVSRGRGGHGCGESTGLIWDPSGIPRGDDAFVDGDAMRLFNEKRLCLSACWREHVGFYTSMCASKAVTLTHYIVHKGNIILWSPLTYSISKASNSGSGT